MSCDHKYYMIISMIMIIDVDQVDVDVHCSAHYNLGLRIVTEGER